MTSSLFFRFMVNSRCILYDSYIFINSNGLSYKKWKQNKKFSNMAFMQQLSVNLLYYFREKLLMFCKKNAGISKIKGFLELKGIFSETKYLCIPMYQIQVFIIILMTIIQRATFLHFKFLTCFLFSENDNKFQSLIWKLFRRLSYKVLFWYNFDKNIIEKISLLQYTNKKKLKTS